MEMDSEEYKSSCGECLRRYDPRKDPEEFCTMLSMFSMLLGLVLLSIGYVIPRDYEYDPYAPAREMEATELYYAALSHTLDICIVVGMGFVGAGGIIITAIMMHGMFCGHLRTEGDQRQLIQPKSGRNIIQYYGSADGGSHRLPLPDERQDGMDKAQTTSAVNAGKSGTRSK